MRKLDVPDDGYSFMFLGIDFGKKRIGLAIGQLIPKGAGVLDGTKSIDSLIDEVKKICLENEIETIVIGWPTLPSGDIGALSGEIKNFGDKLSKATGLPIVYEEEELTSVAAEEILRNAGLKYERKSGEKDEMAAILILEQYINHLDKKNK